MAYTLATLAVCALALPVFTYVQLRRRDSSLRGWTGFWLVLLVRQCLLSAAASPVWTEPLAAVCALLAAAMLLFSARQLFAEAHPRLLDARWRFAAWGVTAAGVAAAFAPGSAPRLAGMAAALLLAAVVVLLWASSSWPLRLLALAVGIWAAALAAQFQGDSAAALAALVLLSWAMLWVIAQRGHAPAASAEQLQLYRQSVRRSREFEILTHIGTAINSSLHGDGLLQTIHAQLQKLMDVRCFYVAFQDLEADLIRFEFEIENGELRAPRTRPRTHALTEHVIATGQPLLVTRDLNRFLREHGLARSGTPARTWMGVPVLLHGEACGVIAVQTNERENAYDTGHLHVLEILAAQAGVAMENARLFAEVQRDAGEKAFLNHIARLTISTNDTGKMLADVAEAIARDLHYDHVAVALPRIGEGGLLGLRVAAVAGGHAQGLAVGDILAWGRGLAGRAAESRSAQALPAHAAAENRVETWTRCPQARSGLALPILYVDELLGVLHLEDHAAAAIGPGHVLVLQTITDQLAVALNHATLFQQMQHLAITDSLTGVKSRRFFMEALQAEWRRARAARAQPETGSSSFAIVLVDLDGFKPLNDRHGHLEGDKILVRVAHLLEQRSRASSVVARYGGDEFTILVPACDPEAARQLPHRLQEALDDDPVLAQRQLRGSFGLAIYPSSGATPEELLHAADAEMYRMKQTRQHRAAAPRAG